MDRRQRKLEKKKKKRELVHKRARADEASRPTPEQRLMNQGARAPFGPCALSNGWNSEETPELVSAVVTRSLPDGELVVGIALVDRTCLGVKNGFTTGPLAPAELDALLEEIGLPHGGMETMEPLVVQSVVFNAVDYARRLGFEPHADFAADLFGPRPAELLTTPWHRAARPLCLAGPDDNVARIRARLTAAVGAGNFELITAPPLGDLLSAGDDALEDEDALDDEDALEDEDESG